MLHCDTVAKFIVDTAKGLTFCACDKASGAAKACATARYQDGLRIATETGISAVVFSLLDKDRDLGAARFEPSLVWLCTRTEGTSLTGEDDPAAVARHKAHAEGGCIWLQTHMGKAKIWETMGPVGTDSVEMGIGLRQNAMRMRRFEGDDGHIVR